MKKPFVRVLFQESEDKARYINTIINHMDIAIDGDKGLENSSVLALYSQSEYIVKFCCLAKMWAKSHGFINF